MNVRVVGSVATMATAVILAGCTSDATRSALPTGPLGSPSVSLTSTGIAGTSGSAAGTSAETSAETSSVTPVVEPSAAATSGTLASTSSSTTTTTTTTTTTIPPRFVTEGAVVLVANASNVDGAAGRLTERLRDAGFTLQKATDAAGIEADLESSKVYVVAGSEAVARSVAAFLGNVPLSYMPTPISIAGGPEMLGKATVVVMLGHDMAK